MGMVKLVVVLWRLAMLVAAVVRDSWVQGVVEKQAPGVEVVGQMSQVDMDVPRRLVAVAGRDLPGSTTSA